MRSSGERRIDLNADVGEGPGEEPLYALISSANIACGGHTGTEATMREAVSHAMRHGVAIGAHPSYPDRSGFGRVSKSMTPDGLSRTIVEQIEALARVARALGAEVTHVKPHGALYNDAAAQREVATAVGEGVLAISSDLVLVGLAGSTALGVWRDLGLRVAAEGFADRAYDARGQLRPRTQSGSLIVDPAIAAVQAVRLAREGCETVCVHADTKGALLILDAVRRALEAAGYAIVSRDRRGGESGPA